MIGGGGGDIHRLLSVRVTIVERSSTYGAGAKGSFLPALTLAGRRLITPNQRVSSRESLRYVPGGDDSPPGWLSPPHLPLSGGQVRSGQHAQAPVATAAGSAVATGVTG